MRVRACVRYARVQFFVHMSEGEAVRRLLGNKDVGLYPLPHRLPHYPFLDPLRQRREIRALK